MTLRMKEWLYAEAIAKGVTPCAIYERLTNGKYPRIILHRKNQRVIYVECPPLDSYRSTSAFQTTPRI